MDNLRATGRKLLRRFSKYFVAVLDWASNPGTNACEEVIEWDASTMMRMIMSGYSSKYISEQTRT